MKISLQDALQAKRIDDLNKLGKFIEVKNSIESQLNLKLGINGWSSLLSKLNLLSTSFSENSEYINLIFNEKTFREVKSKISKKLGFKITAKNQSELKVTIQTLSLYFLKTHFDPHKRFEEKKLKNFINSSRLEGIKIPSPDEKTSLESILAKHRR